MVNCAVCGTTLCIHGRLSLWVEASGTHWYCHDCGESGTGNHPVTYFVPMYEGRIVNPNTHEWGGYDACKECSESGAIQ